MAAPVRTRGAHGPCAAAMRRRALRCAARRARAFGPPDGVLPLSAGDVLVRTGSERNPKRVGSVGSAGSLLPSNKGPHDTLRLPRIGHRPGTNQRSSGEERVASSPLASGALGGPARAGHRERPGDRSPGRTISSPVPPTQPRAHSERAIASKRPSICTAFSKSSADALALVAASLGWAVHAGEREDSSVYWVVSAEHMRQRLRKLKAGQVVARVPGMHDMAKKCSFSRLMTRSQKLYPTLFDFYPQTWNLPDDLAQMQQALKGPSMDWSRDAVIVKPDDGSQGDGIFISTSYEDLTSRLSAMRYSIGGTSEVVVQRYLARPLLLGGYKFDLRVYVLVRSLEPLDVWVCREGLARFCTEPYRAPTGKNCHKVMGHLTNYSLNKRSDGFVKCSEGAGNDSAGVGAAAPGGPESKDEEKRGGEDDAGGGVFAPPTASQDGASKRTMSHTMSQIRAAGIDTAAVWDEITTLVRRTCQIMQPFLKNATQEQMPQGSGDVGWEAAAAGQCIHLLGFDVMLDDKGHCHLLEINCSPRLGVDAVEPVDKDHPPENPTSICRCIDDPRPHVHVRCEIDRFVKAHVLAGSLLLLARQRRRQWGEAGIGISSHLASRVIGLYQKVLGASSAASRGRASSRGTAQSSRPSTAASAASAEDDGGGALEGEGGVEEFGLGAKVQELYVRVGGSKRKIDSGRLRLMVKAMGLGSQLGLSLVDTLYQKAKAKYRRPVDLDIFWEILDSLAAEAFPPASFPDTTPYEALNSLLQMASGMGGEEGERGVVLRQTSLPPRQVSPMSSRDSSPLACAAARRAGPSAPTFARREASLTRAGAGGGGGRGGECGGDSGGSGAGGAVRRGASWAMGQSRDPSPLARRAVPLPPAASAAAAAAAAASASAGGVAREGRRRGEERAGGGGGDVQDEKKKRAVAVLLRGMKTSARPPRGDKSDPAREGTRARESALDPGKDAILCRSEGKKSDAMALALKDTYAKASQMLLPSSAVSRPGTSGTGLVAPESNSTAPCDCEGGG